MAEPLRFVAPQSVLTGWDFSTGAVKCLKTTKVARPAPSLEPPKAILDPRKTWTATFETSCGSFVVRLSVRGRDHAEPEDVSEARRPGDV